MQKASGTEDVQVAENVQPHQPPQTFTAQSTSQTTQVHAVCHSEMLQQFVDTPPLQEIVDKAAMQIPIQLDASHVLQELQVQSGQQVTGQSEPVDTSLSAEYVNSGARRTSQEGLHIEQINQMPGIQGHAEKPTTTLQYPHLQQLYGTTDPPGQLIAPQVNESTTMCSYVWHILKHIT